MTKDILSAAIGWAVPLVLGWILLKIPSVGAWLANNPTIKAVAIGGLLSFLVSATAVFVYDKYILPQELSQWPAELKVGNLAPTNGGYGPVTTNCPVGYYAVGLKSWGNSSPPYCIGCLNATEVQCRKLPIAAQ
jgi:hypothetical protein